MSTLLKNLMGHYDKQVWILFGGSLINSFGFSIAYPFISLYLYLYRGVSMSDVGMALLIAAAIGSLGQIAGGELCDRFGRKGVMNVGVALNVLAFALLTTAVLLQADFVVFVLLLCLREIAGGLYRNIPTVMVADIVPVGDRNGAFSLLRIGGNFGFALGPILGGVIALYSYAALFAVTTFCSIAYLLISIFLLKDTKPDKCEVDSTRPKMSILKDRPFIWLCIVSMAISVVYAQMLTTFSTYSGSYGQLNESLIGILFSLNGFMIVLIQYPLAIFLNRFRSTTSLMAGTLLYALGFGIVGLCTGFWPLFICMFIITAGELVYTPPYMNITSRMSPPENRGRYMTFSVVIGNAGFAFGPAIGGFLMDYFATDIAYMWFLLGALALICVLGYGVLRLIIRPEIDMAAGN